jgi:hypothetical protein
MVNEAHLEAWRHADPRHHRADASRRLWRQGREGELLTGIEGVSIRPVRRIVL